MNWLKKLWTSKPRNKRADKLTIEVAEERTRVYNKLFELEKIDNALDAMVKRSLELMEPKK